MQPVALIVIGLAALIFVGGSFSLTSAQVAPASCSCCCLTPGVCLEGANAMVGEFAKAIAFAEGYWDQNGNALTGNLPYRNNNPGDIVRAGAYVVFATSEQGFDALYSELNLIVAGKSAYYNLSMSISEMSKKWTTTQQDAWARNVATWLGANVSDSIGQWLT